MRLILDTCTFLWLASAPPRLSRLAADLIADPENEALFSAVSARAIRVKHALGRLLLPQGLSAAAFIRRHALATALRPCPSKKATPSSWAVSLRCTRTPSTAC
jgi:PIN domain nuclease of toxin-antitoxin system